MAVTGDVARQVVDESWRDDFVDGAIQTALMRPGRGHSARGSDRGGWRYEMRRVELRRSARHVTDLIEGLQPASPTPEQARRSVEDGPYAGSVLVADSKARMVRVPRRAAPRRR